MDPVPIFSAGERTANRTATVDGIGGPVAEIARTPRVTVHEAIESAREVGFEQLQEMPVCELLERIGVAGQLFVDEGTPAASTESDLLPFDVYRRRVVRATGLPTGWVRVGAHWIAFALRHAAESLRVQSPTAELGVYDDPSYTRETNVGLAFAPRVRVLGASMPANDPTVYAWPLLALSMKIPVVIRPSDSDPFTAVRLVRALRAAGIPESGIHLLPGDHAIGRMVCREADHAMAFGGRETIGPFEDDQSVETYGPGESVAIVSRDPTAAELDSLARGITRMGGRTCLNLTRIVATNQCEPNNLADKLARRVGETSDGSLFDPDADVPGFVDADRADRVDSRLSDRGTDFTQRYRTGPRRTDGDVVRLRPTVLRTDELVEELPFPFAGVTHRDRTQIPECLDDTYLGVVIGDEAIERAMVRTPAIRKVYSGRYPAAMDLRETHETFLATILYETTTYASG